MARKKKKQEPEYSGPKRGVGESWMQYKRRMRVRSKKLRERMQGAVIEDQPPITRKDAREMAHSDQLRKRPLGLDGEGEMQYTTDRPYTKPSEGALRKQRRAHNKRARLARRKNRQ